MAARRSMWVYALYLTVVGLTLVLAPNVLLGLFGFETTTEVWIRVMGMLLLILAFYDAMAARSADFDFIGWSVPARAVVLPVFLLFVAMSWARPMLLLFGAVDFAGAAWTWFSLRRAAC